MQLIKVLAHQANNVFNHAMPHESFLDPVQCPGLTHVTRRGINVTCQ